MSTVSGRIEDYVLLTGESDTRRGAVEVYRDKAWGRICSEGLDNDAASVVCSQLGFVR